MPKYRKLPVEIEAIQFTRKNNKSNTKCSFRNIR